MSTISEYIKGFAKGILDKRVQVRLTELCMAIAIKGTNKIWVLGNNESVYRGFSRLLDNDNFGVEEVGKYLFQESKEKIKKYAKVFVALDGSDIRKQFSRNSEKLDKVRGLDGQSVNGYHSSNCLAITPDNHEQFIIECEVYSTKEDDFKSKNDVALRQIQNISSQFKSSDIATTPVFLMDREYDNMLILKEIQNQNQEYIVRAKHVDRLVKIVGQEDLKIKEIYLKDIKFKPQNKHEVIYETFEIKGRKYKNVRLVLEWENVILPNKDYTKKEMEKGEGTTLTPKQYSQGLKNIFIKARLLNSDNQSIFKDPKLGEFYILTNQPIANLTRQQIKERILEIYQNYFLRWKIETVFRFTKQTLGLEDFRIQKLKHIKKLILLTMLVASYFVRLGKHHDPTDPENQAGLETIKWLCKLGGIKGRIKNKSTTTKEPKTITKYFVQQGLQHLLGYIETLHYWKTNNLTKQQIKQMLDYIGYGHLAEVGDVSGF